MAQAAKRENSSSNRPRSPGAGQCLGIGDESPKEFRGLKVKSRSKLPHVDNIQAPFGELELIYIGSRAAKALSQRSLTEATFDPQLRQPAPDRLKCIRASARQ